MLIDARQVAAETEFVRDLCIVGAGPAGIAIALALVGSGLTVALLEGGGLDFTLASQSLYDGDNVGHRYFRLDGCRFRMFGGSTNRWGGWCRPLDASDYETRPWVRASGWPIGEEAVKPYYARTAEMFDISSAEFELPAWLTRLPAPLPFGDGADFDSEVFQYSPQTNIGEKYRAEVLGEPSITTLVNANVTGFELDEGSNRVGVARVRTLGGSEFTVRARSFVLATGGLENARLLLASQADRPAGLGNEHDVVGRYFQEHLHVPVGHLIPSERLEHTDFYLRATRDGVRTRGVLVPSLEAQRREGLPTCSIAVEDQSYSFGTPYVGWRPQVVVPAVRTLDALRHSPARALGARLRGATEVAYDLSRQFETARLTRGALRRSSVAPAPGGRVRSFYFRTEQEPNPDSRVTLVRDKDALGVPKIALDWRVPDSDLAVVSRWLERLTTSFAKAGLGTVVPPAPGWSEKVIGGPHHIGTTRMSADPRTGVVDADCKVHSVDNLYVAGSSVFATGGYVNPTFSLVALALRLADHLHARLR